MESAGVRGLVAQIEREHFWIGDLAVGGVEAGGLQVLGTVGEPMRFRHGEDEDGFGFGCGLVFGSEPSF